MYQYISSLVKNFKVSGNDSDGRKAVKKRKTARKSNARFSGCFQTMKMEEEKYNYIITHFSKKDSLFLKKM